MAQSFTRGEELDFSFIPTFDAIDLSGRKGLVEIVSAP